MTKSLDAMDPEADPNLYLSAAEGAYREAKKVYPQEHPVIAARRQAVATGLVAVEKFDEAIAIQREIDPILKLGGANFRKPLADLYSLNAVISDKKGDTAAALVSVNKSLSLYGELSGKQPNLDYATELANRAAFHFNAGHTESALTDNGEAIAIAARLKASPPILATWFANRANYLLTIGKAPEAIEIARAAVLRFEPQMAKGHPQVAFLYANYAALLVRQNKPSEALEFARKGYEKLELAANGPTALSAQMRAIAVTALVQAGSFEDAAPVIEQALPIMDAKMGVAHPQTLQVREIYARVLQRLGRGREAIGIQQQLLKTRDAALQRLHADRMTGRVNLAVIAMRIGEFKIATTAMDEGLALRREAVPAVHPEFLAERALALHIRALDGQGGAALAKEAHAVFGGLRQIMDLDLDAPTPNGAHAGMLYVGESLFRSGDKDGAFRAQQWTARTSVDDAVALTRVNRAVAGEQTRVGTQSHQKVMDAARKTPAM